MHALSFVARFALFLAIPISAMASADKAFPILFVTPVNAGDAERAYNDRSDLVPDTSRRGLDLCVRYPDGKIRNLTAEAGFFENFAGSKLSVISIADPAVSWDGKSAVFSMKLKSVIGPEVFQLYSVSGLEEDAPIQIGLVANQPGNTDNTHPVFDADGAIFFSAQSLDGVRATRANCMNVKLASQCSPTGIWRVDPASEKVAFVRIFPSGVFKLTWDEFGAVDFILTNDSAPRNVRIVRRDIRREKP